MKFYKVSFFSRFSNFFFIFFLTVFEKFPTVIEKLFEKLSFFSNVKITGLRKNPSTFDYRQTAVVINYRRRQQSAFGI